MSNLKIIPPEGMEYYIENGEVRFRKKLSLDGIYEQLFLNKTIYYMDDSGWICEREDDFDTLIPYDNRTIVNNCTSKKQVEKLLAKQGVIVPAGLTFMDGYVWKNSEPIHMNRVIELFEMTRKKVSAQCKKYRDGRKTEQVGTEESKNPVKKEEESVPEEHKELIPIDKAINKAIKLLLEHGYKITRPVVTYEEVTIKNL